MKYLISLLVYLLLLTLIGAIMIIHVPALLNVPGAGVIVVLLIAAGVAATVLVLAGEL